MLFINSAFIFCSFCSLILPQNCFVFFAWGFWFVFGHSPPTSWLNILSLCWNVLLCLYYLTLSQYLLSLPSFANIFYFICPSCIVWLACCFIYFFSPQHIFIYFSFLSTFVSCHSFFTCPFCLIYHPGFVSMLEFLWRTLISSLTGSSILAIKGATADLDTQILNLSQ